MRIALWNGSGLNNLGDRLLDYINRRELGRRLPSAIFHSFSPWPSSSVPLVQIDDQGYWGNEQRFNAIVIGGGALLIGPPFVHPSLQTCYLGPYPERFRDVCPIIWNAVCSDGQFVPLLAEPWRAYVRSAAARLTYHSVRNQRTANLLTQCGVSDSISIVPDPVILLRSPGEKSRPRRVRRRIGIMLGVNAYSAALTEYLASSFPRRLCNAAVCVRTAPEALLAQAESGSRQSPHLLNSLALCL